MDEQLASKTSPRAFAGKVIYCERPSTLVDAILSLLRGVCSSQQLRMVQHETFEPRGLTKSLSRNMDLSIVVCHNRFFRKYLLTSATKKSEVERHGLSPRAKHKSAKHKSTTASASLRRVSAYYAEIKLCLSRALGYPSMTVLAKRVSLVKILCL